VSAIAVLIAAALLRIIMLAAGPLWSLTPTTTAPPPPLVVTTTTTTAPPPASCHDLIGELGPEWSPSSIGYTVTCYPGPMVAYPLGGFVSGYVWVPGRQIHLADETTVWVAAHEVSHIVLNHDWTDPSIEAEANCHANLIMGWAPHPDCV